MTAEALPLVLATVFTAGGIVIQKAQRHADAIGHALGFVFSVVVTLLILEFLVQALPQAVGVLPPAERAVAAPPKLVGRGQMWD